ncbi:hypothetical protein [Ruegeria atlantica]|uniref:hypothetical protein n=1 Tax=Ruegeria atlantica TaxID=81569 RepID=UPI00148011AB|nr:hypothetical protein [Ruegeria atlantica]
MSSSRPEAQSNQHFERIGLDTVEQTQLVDQTGETRQHFGPQVLEANAAITGQGVAMLTPAFFRDELATG